MNIVFVRSPFFVEVNEIGQQGSKIELYIWNKGTTEPTVSTYTLSKKIPSTSQINTNYNISNFVKEFINIINPFTVSTPSIEDDSVWVNFKIKRYKLAGSTYTLLDTIQYVGVNGYTNYLNGFNYIGLGNIIALSNPNNTIYTYDTNIPYSNILIERDLTHDYIATYYDASGAILNTTTILTSGAIEIYNFRVPISYGDSVTCIVSFNSIDVLNFSTQKIDECKYYPLVCSFINRYGGWQFLTFFKAQTTSISVKGTNYSLLPDNINYNPNRGQNSSFNINGMQSIKINTGFVPENYSELMTDLLLSEVILLDGTPVNAKTQSLTYKTSLFDRNINYEMEFDYSFNLINDVL